MNLMKPTPAVPPKALKKSDAFSKNVGRELIGFVVAKDWQTRYDLSWSNLWPIPRKGGIQSPT
jgi:hypothetical protein